MIRYLAAVLFFSASPALSHPVAGGLSHGHSEGVGVLALVLMAVCAFYIAIGRRST